MPVRFPAASVRGFPEFLNIDMRQVTGPGSFVSHRRWLPDREAGGLVEIRKLRHLNPVKYSLDRGTENSDVVADAMRTPVASEPEQDGAMFTIARQTSRRRLRTRGTVA